MRDMNPSRLLLPVMAVAALLPLLPADGQVVARIREGDAVTITIRGVPDKESQMISGVYKVDQGGALVGLPYLEDRRISAAGVTEGQLSSMIASAYKDADIFTKATITAIVDQPNARSTRRVTVGGMAKRPGPVEWAEGMTAYDAFSNAGGADRFGHLKRVFLMRGNQKQTLNMDDDRDKMVKLLPGDTLEIDKKKAWEP